MEEDLVQVMDENSVLASRMTVENALIFVKAYFEKYFDKPDLCLYVGRMAKTQVGENTEN